MDNDERDQPLANLAALLVGQVAGFYVHKELLHLVAIVELAAGRTRTFRGVFQNLEVTLQTLRAFGLALLGFGRLLQTDSRKGMTGVVHVRLIVVGWSRTFDRAFVEGGSHERERESVIERQTVEVRARRNPG